MLDDAFILFLKDTATLEAFVLGRGIRAGPLRFFLRIGLAFQETRWILEDCKTDDDLEKAYVTFLWIESEGYIDDELNLTLRDHVACVVDTHAACPSWDDPAVHSACAGALEAVSQPGDATAAGSHQDRYVERDAWRSRFRAVRWLCLPLAVVWR